MLFGKYLKLCREKYNLTQEELVQECYSYSDDFNGLDIGTVSRWERSITNPSVDKQIKITKLLQRYEDVIFPYFSTYDIFALENELCKSGVKNLIGNSKEHILNFPHSNIIEENIKITNVQDAQDKDMILKMPNDIVASLIDNHYGLNIEILKEWASHKWNLFLVSEYENNFFGMMLVVRLKPDVFEDILSFKRELKTLKSEDFCQNEEIGCSFPVTFFAYNQTIASLLYLRYYANLIANQNLILEVGSTPIIDSAVKLVEKTNLKKYKTMTSDKGEITSYRAKLEDVLLTEEVFKMVFRK